MVTIVAISRQFGSGGARIGRALAQRLGFQYVDREILAAAARELEVQADDLEPLEERTASVWERIGTLFALGAPDTPFIPPTLPKVTESQLFAVERKVIQSIAAKGQAVIVGRAAAHVLPPGPAVLRVFLHAPLSNRIALAMEEYGFASEPEAEAVVRQSDTDRATFIRTVAGRNWYDATGYDVTLDTGALGHERVVDLLAEVVRRPPTTPLPPIAPRTAADRDAR